MRNSPQKQISELTLCTLHIYIYIIYIYIYISFFSEGLRIPGIPLWKGLLLLYRYHLNPKTPIFHYMIVTTFNWRCGQVHRVPKSGGYPRKTRGWWLLVGCEPNRVQKIDAIDSGWSSIDRPRGIPKLWCDWSFFLVTNITLFPEITGLVNQEPFWARETVHTSVFEARGGTFLNVFTSRTWRLWNHSTSTNRFHR